MKNLKIKFLVAILAFAIGVIGVWASGVLSSLSFFFVEIDPWMEIDVAPTNEPFLEQAFGNVEVRFRRRLKIEGENYAEFEIVNHHRLPVGYIGYGKDSYCTTGVKVNDSVEQNNQCWCGTGLEMQILRNGETALYQVSESEVRHLLKKDKRKVTTQIGFEFLVGAERRKELVWSEKVSFPK